MKKERIRMKTILLVFGTRPEAIKMCPLVKELRKRQGMRVPVCVTGQHREMLDSVLRIFDVSPDYDLDVMEAGQTLCDVTARILRRLPPILDRTMPDTVLVHGDTATAFATALVCFYRGIRIGHVEAGLRTYDMRRPFPEEFHRRAIALMAEKHFAPTESARARLLSEGIDRKSIYVTGNTAIDALKTTVRKDYKHPVLQWASGSRLLLLTLHRRESLGEPMRYMFRAIRNAVEEHPSAKLVCPMHKNPAVRAAAEELCGCPRIRLIEPLAVSDFHNFLARSDIVLTDSGGIQEEAPALHKPVLVLRDTTERTEGVEAGALWLVGTKAKAITTAIGELLKHGERYSRMINAKNPYGDGLASQRIAAVLEKE